MTSFLTELLRLMSQVPGTFWGVVVGSFFTLLGTHLTNRANTNRLRLQLQNDRELRNRDREMAIRKEVFGGAVEAAAVAIRALARISDLSFQQKELAAVLGDNSHLFARVNLVANEDTIRALLGFTSELQGSFLRLSAKRLVLEPLYEQIQNKAGFMNQLAATRETVLVAMRQHNIDGLTDARRFEALKAIFDFEMKRGQDAATEIEQLRAELWPLQLTLAKECFAELSRVSRLAGPAHVALRKELDLPISIDAFAKVIEEAQRRAEVQIDEYIQLVGSPLRNARTTAPESNSPKGAISERSPT